MCGIVGYVGKRSAQDVLLDGLEKLEYRGYDSAGVALALDGGADGLIFYRAICDIWAKKLHPNGVLAVEIGETQGQAVKVLFEAAGLRDVRIHKDLGALDRAVSGVR